jgi:hypothetical protein
LFCRDLNTSWLLDVDGSDLNDPREVKLRKLVRDRNVFTVKQDSPVNEGDVSREEKQDGDRCPRSKPDEGDFEWECQKVVVNLAWPSVATNVRIK